MSKKFELNKDFLAELSRLIQEKETKLNHKKVEKIHPSDIADILENLDEKKAQFLFEIIEEKKSADAIVELEDEVRESLLSELTAKEIAEEVIDNLESDDAADVIGDLSDEKKKKVLS